MLRKDRYLETWVESIAIDDRFNRYSWPRANGLMRILLYLQKYNNLPWKMEDYYKI